ncbi:zinc finger, CCHC-type containing protein [Tanacetum coccineum]
MHFFLSSMSVVYVLTTPIPKDGGDDETVEQLKKRAKWDNDEYVYRGLIPNGMSDSLFDIYQNVESSKELWDSLEAKYMAEYASNFKYTLKHQKEDLTLVELYSHLCIEKSLRMQDSDKKLEDDDVEWDAIFNENIFSSVPRPSLRISNGTKDIGGSVVPQEVTEEVANLLDANGSLKKLKVNGTIEKFKERLVIQGFRQKLKIDYFDIYAPVACISIIKPLIAMASIHNLIIHQMDVKIPFLNDELDKYVYMNQPQGFIMPGNENKVCKLIKSLYRLKQAPK